MPDSVTRKKTSNDGAAVRSPSRAPKEWVVTCLICILLVGIVWIVFGQTLRHEFVNYDDDQYVRENPRITRGLTLDGIQWAFTHVHAANWHPLTTISHMLDCQLYGLQPWGHHLTSVLLHAAAALFLFFALHELTRTLWPSAFVAALFAIHPLRISSVAWVAERKDVLSGVFFMLTLWAYGRYVRSNRPSSGRYTIALVLFALGLMCKPALVTLPCVLLLLDYWPLQRFAQSRSIKPARSRRDPVTIRRGESPSRGGSLPTRTVGYLLLEKIPFFVLSAASCVATLLAQGRAVMTIRQLAFGDRLANAVVSYVAYIGQMIWPAGLAVVYPFPLGGWNVLQTMLALLVLLIISLVCFLWRTTFPFLLVGWLWFLGVLVPMIGIIQVGLQARADRYTYLAQIGLYLAVTWGTMEMFSRWRGGRIVLIAIALLIVTGLMADSYSQTSAWRNSEALWNQALANTSNNYIAHNGVGDALMLKGQLDDAVTHFRKALEICVDCWEVHFNLGHVLAKKGDWLNAITSYRAALQAWPTPNAHNHNDLGICLAKVGKVDEAIDQFREALRIDGDFPDAHRNLAILLLQVGQREEAVIHLREVLRLQPDDAKIKAQLHQLEVEK
jgi:Flp pilus assembly protein TadD